MQNIASAWFFIIYTHVCLFHLTHKNEFTEEGYILHRTKASEAYSHSQFERAL